MVVKKRKTADTWKKKEWYTIISPKIFKEMEIGTTPATDERKLKNRIIKVPLRDITNNMGHQFTKLFFRITEVKGKNAYTEFKGFELTKEYLRRNVRRRRSLIRIVREITTKDKKNITITVYAFTFRKVDTSKKNSIRKMMLEFLDKNIKKMTLESVIQKSLYGEFSTDILKKIKVVAPTRRVEVYKLVILGGK